MGVDYSAIGRRMKQKRKQAGMTQDNLAEKLSVSVGYISQMERGVTKISLETLSRRLGPHQRQLLLEIADVIAKY